MLSPSPMGTAVHMAFPHLRNPSPPDIDGALEPFLKELQIDEIPLWQRQRIHYAWHYLHEFLSMADDWSFERSVRRRPNADLIVLYRNDVYVVEVKIIATPDISTGTLRLKLLKGTTQVRSTMGLLNRRNRRFRISGYILYLHLAKDAEPDALWMDVDVDPT